jgi:hypothetical protein
MLRVHAGNYLQLLSDMLHFKGTENPGNHILNFQKYFSYNFFFIQVSTI